MCDIQALLNSLLGIPVIEFVLKYYISKKLLPYSQKFVIEVIFKTFENPMTFLKIKMLKCALYTYIAIDIKRRELFLSPKCINEVDFQNFSHSKISIKLKITYASEKKYK